MLSSGFLSLGFPNNSFQIIACSIFFLWLDDVLIFKDMVSLCLYFERMLVSKLPVD